MFLVPQFLMIWATLYLKNQNDMLQGINKLDYLIQVSVLQRYKNKDLNRQKGFSNLDDDTTVNDQDKFLLHQFGVEGSINSS